VVVQPVHHLLRSACRRRLVGGLRDVGVLKSDDAANGVGFCLIAVVLRNVGEHRLVFGGGRAANELCEILGRSAPMFALFGHGLAPVLTGIPFVQGNYNAIRVTCQAFPRNSSPPK
jgi:hypothetical protein